MGWTSTADPLAHVGRSALEFERHVLRRSAPSLPFRCALAPAARPLSALAALPLTRCRSAEAAQEFAKRQGWAYDLLQPAQQSLGSTCTRGAGKRGTRVKQYSDNFSVQRRGTPVWVAGQSGGK